MAINLKENTIHSTQDRPASTINRWEVWFAVPMLGLFSKRQEAIKACEDVDWDPNEVILPTPVAIDDEDYYEVRMG